MVNHMAQGVATSMEDGVFLGVGLKPVVEGRMALRDAVALYEKERMSLARMKQEISFLNGAIWHLPDGDGGESEESLASRMDGAMRAELREQRLVWSPNLYSDPVTTLGGLWVRCGGSYKEGGRGISEWGRKEGWTGGEEEDSG
jgi:salicylate hydroxylase